MEILAATIIIGCSISSKVIDILMLCLEGIGMGSPELFPQLPNQEAIQNIEPERIRNIYCLKLFYSSILTS